MPKHKVVGRKGELGEGKEPRKIARKKEMRKKRRRTGEGGKKEGFWPKRENTPRKE